MVEAWWTGGLTVPWLSSGWRPAVAMTVSFFMAVYSPAKWMVTNPRRPGDWEAEFRPK